MSPDKVFDSMMIFESFLSAEFRVIVLSILVLAVFFSDFDGWIRGNQK